MKRAVTSTEHASMLQLVYMVIDDADPQSGVPVMTVTEAASQLRVTRQSVLKMVKADHILPFVWWARQMYFKVSDVEKLKSDRES